jgi:glucose/arabinose dehydrogenase
MHHNSQLDLTPISDASNLQTLRNESGVLATASPGDLTRLQERFSTASSLTFIDADLAEQVGLAPGVASNFAGNTEIHLLHSGRSGLDQISEVLAQRQGITSLHLYSHGNSSGLHLGNTQLNGPALTAYGDQIQGWQSALSPDADILLYGCNLAETTAGQDWIRDFARITTADIAASVDLTGNAAQGGDWDLEYTTGQIEADQSLRPWLEQRLQQTLINPVINYANFSDTSNLQLNGNASGAGNAAGTGNVLALTPDLTNQRGSAFYRDRFDLDGRTSFKTQFQFRLTGATSGADGFAFVIQNGANTALGGGGGGTGYSGITRSLAIEFDTYRGSGDPNNNHISLLQNGVSTAPLRDASTSIDLNSGQAINAWVEYSGMGDRLDVFLSNTTTKPTSATLSYNIDLPAVLGGNTAHIGFTAATGGRSNGHTIETWQLTTTRDNGDDPVTGNGDGLSATYFDNLDFTGPSVSRIDPGVNFNWGLGSPAAGIGEDTFSARWTGQVQPRYSGDYTFFTTSDDGVRLYINDQLVIDRFVDQGPTEVASTPIRLERGQKYDIRMDYYENRVGAVAQLAWESPMQVKEIIPQSQLYSGGTKIALGTSAVTVSEGDGFVDIPLIRSGNLTGTSTVDVRTIDGTALAGSDYTAENRTITFAPGQSQQTVRINLRDDELNEGLESFAFNIDNPGGAQLTAPRTVQISITDDDSTGAGLTGEYFDDAAFSDFKFLRTDPTVNFDWGSGSPDPRIQADTFSVRWSGKIQPRYSERYRFFTDADDSVKLFVNGTQVISETVAGEYSNTIDLVAGQLYDIRMELTEVAGNARAKLSWASARQAKEIVPNSQLFAVTNEASVFEFNRDSFTINENGTQAEILLQRNATSTGNAASVIVSTVDFADPNQTATAGSDYTSVSQRVVFAPGEAFRRVFIPITNDSQTEWNERLNLTLSAARNEDMSTAPAPSIGPRSSTNLTIVDDELGVSRQVVSSGFTEPTQFIWVPGDNNKILVAEKGGKVRLVDNGVLRSQDVINLEAEVNNAGDRGLLSIALHPDFQTGSPYLYLLYTDDLPEVTAGQTGVAGVNGEGNRPGRLLRVTLDPATLTVVPGSRTYILGGAGNATNTVYTVNSTVDLTAPESGRNSDGSFIQDYIPTDSTSHGVGQIRFAPDKSLFVSIGDGASYNRPDSRAVRVLDNNSLSGKLLRINPLTGQGYADNPFATTDLTANASKVWSLGLRNPFRFAFRPGTDQFYVGDVGWNTWEEINSGKGKNFGWPAYEGGDVGNALQPSYQQFAPIRDFVNNPNTQVEAPQVAFNHTRDNVAAIIMGDVYSGTSGLPSFYNNAPFFSTIRFANGRVGSSIYAAQLDATGKIISTKRLLEDEPNGPGASRVVNMQMGPDGNLYYLNLDKGQINRLR